MLNFKDDKKESSDPQPLDSSLKIFPSNWVYLPHCTEVMSFIIK